METTFTKRNSHGANLKRWREWRGIKQEVLADKIGVSQATLSGYEKKDELEPEVLEKVTKALDIPHHEGNRAINVSVGTGGFIPFRFGASHEISVITLHRK